MVIKEGGFRPPPQPVALVGRRQTPWRQVDDFFRRLVPEAPDVARDGIMTGATTVSSTKLRSIQDRFAGQLPARMAGIIAAGGTLKGGAGGDALEAFQLLVHRMAGSSTTFVFITLGENSLCLEDVLYPILNGGWRPDPKTARIIGGLLRDMWDAAQAPDKWP